MSDLNNFCCTGYLGADVESRKFQSGDPVINMRVAVSDQWKDSATGEKREKTLWLPVVITNKGLCRIAETYLRKGSRVALSGALQQREWVDKDGGKHTVVELVLGPYNASLTMLDGATGDKPASKPSPADDPRFDPPGGGGMDDDAIPFGAETRI